MKGASFSPPCVTSQGAVSQICNAQIFSKVERDEEAEDRESSE